LRDITSFTTNYPLLSLRLTCVFELRCQQTLFILFYQSEKKSTNIFETELYAYFLFTFSKSFVLIIFITWYKSLIYSIIIFFTLQILQYLFLNYIHRHPNKFFSIQWENTINSKIFQENRQDVRPLKFISMMLYEDYVEKKGKKLNRLRDWSNKRELIEQTPIPIHYLNVKNEVNDEIQKKIQEMSEIFTIQTIQEISLKDDKKTSTNLEKCPTCGKIIIFGNFCADCNIKFCPKCQMETNPHSKRCLC